MDERLASLEQLQSTTCKCGNSKHTGASFCRSCYYKLPPIVRKSLWQRVGCGYEQAYAFACRLLKQQRVTQS